MDISATQRYLRRRFEAGEAVLFTGAGFSRGVSDRVGSELMTGWGVRNKIYELCYGHEAPKDDNSTLQDVFDSALRRCPAELAELIDRVFVVDSQTIPEHYEAWFSAPWLRIYTLNVDDMEAACERKFSLPRGVLSLSAISEQRTYSPTGTSGKLEVVHLNGMAEDGIRGVTFSTTQYAQRLVAHDPWYMRLAAELASRCFVFVGTELDEPQLWQHIELRGERAARRGATKETELRPKSFIVTPKISRARADRLKDYNIEWLRMSAAEFAEKVLLPAARGLRSDHIFLDGAPTDDVLPALGQVLADEVPDRRSMFLLGAEPQWADVRQGRAINREFDDRIAERVQELLEIRRAGPNFGAEPYLIVLVGTAGSGKSTSMRRLALRLAALGYEVSWVDRSLDVSPRALRRGLQGERPPDVVMVDDADRYGREFSNVVREMAVEQPPWLVVASARSHRVDRCVVPPLLENVSHDEVTIPPLTNGDIDGLIDALDAANNLGVLKGQSRSSQRNAFRKQAGRQLLVAMLQVTSGRPFEEKVADEWQTLDSHGREAYALIALATSLSHKLAREDILLALNAAPTNQSNAVLNALEALRRRGVVRGQEDGTGFEARHRQIADVLVDHLRDDGRLGRVFLMLAVVAATKVRKGMKRSTAPWRLLRQVLSHKRLRREVGSDLARLIYETLEQYVSWDHHFWLQRGSLELEDGDWRKAENYIAQARSLNAQDPLVETAAMHVLFRKALSAPNSARSAADVDSAMASLRAQIAVRGRYDAYPVHVLGSQGLSWSRKASLSKEARVELLRNLKSDVADALRWHRGEPSMHQLAEDVERELLAVAAGLA